MFKTYFYESFSCDFLLSKIKLKNILDNLKSEIKNLTPEELFDLRLIYNELINNAIVHGNKESVSKKAELFIEADDYSIISTVRDEGDGFDYTRFYISEHYDLSLFMERGRGLMLVASLVDFYEWNAIGNEIKFCKRLTGHEGRYAGQYAFAGDRIVSRRFPAVEN